MLGLLLEDVAEPQDHFSERPCAKLLPPAAAGC